MHGLTLTVDSRGGDSRRDPAFVVEGEKTPEPALVLLAALAGLVVYPTKKG